MQWVTVATPPFGWIDQFDKVPAQLGESRAGHQPRYFGTADGKLRIVTLWESKGARRPVVLRHTVVVPLPRLLRKGCAEPQPALRSCDIDARDVKAQEAAEGCADYERPQEYRQYR
jgi:hypothetical protein